MAKIPMIACIKVSLRDIRPSIWRRVELRADAKLFDLHRIVQAAMGWTDSHQHQFVHNGVAYGESDPDFGIFRVRERHTLVSSVLRNPKERLQYEYDFGDGWEHELVLETLGDAQPGVRYPRVLAGKRACPPEDIGGPGGYEHFLDVMRDPGDAEHEALMEWVGGRFDPEHFDLEAANGNLRGRKILVPAGA